MGISKSEILDKFKAAGLNVSSDAKAALESELMKAIEREVSALKAAKVRGGKKTVYAEDVALMFS